MKFLLSLSFLLMILSCKKSLDLQPTFYDCSPVPADSSSRNPNKSKYQALLNDMTSKGVVGIMMSVHDSKHGMWVGSSGMADLHNNIAMKSCNITRAGSIIKMYVAVTLLKLQEEGKLDLDDKVTDHLNDEILSKIKNTDKSTIRQLLQHSSGIYNYILNPQFQTASLNNLIKEWQAPDLLFYAKNMEPYFQPGEDVHYSNTGYIILGMLIEKIENKPLYQVLDEKIFIPLHQSKSFFAAKDKVPNGIVRGYVDFYSTLEVTESTYYSGWDYFTADGGLISNPYDMNVFIRTLMAGKIINTASLQEMLQWKRPREQDETLFETEYGLGIFRILTSKGVAYIHSGDAIGYYNTMLYFPSDGTTIIYSVNSNYGKIDQLISSKEAMEKIITTIKE